MSEAAENLNIEMDESMDAPDDIAGGGVDEQQLTGDEPEAKEVPADAKEDNDESGETDGDDGEPKVKFTQEQQRIFDREIGRKIAKQREAERELEALRQRLNEIEQRQSDVGDPNMIEIPPMPDIWDDEYESKVAARDKALEERALAKARMQALEDQRMRQLQEQQRREAEDLRAKAQTYTERAVDLGVSPDELKVAGRVVASVGMDDSLVKYILTSEEGPAITVALSESPADLEALATMDPVSAAVHLERNIVPKVKRKVKRQRPPEPVETLRGSGVPEEERGPKGATYE